VLVVEYACSNTNSDRELMYITIRQAQRFAEAADERHGLADALCLLRSARYFETLNNSVPGAAVQVNYDEALAYQRQALELRESMGDTRGVSESLFLIGTVYERLHQYDRAFDYYTQARRIADECGHLYEKTEPARHFAYKALLKGDLEQALTSMRRGGRRRKRKRATRRPACLRRSCSFRSP